MFYVCVCVKCVCAKLYVCTQCCVTYHINFLRTLGLYVNICKVTGIFMENYLCDPMLSTRTNLTLIIFSWYPHNTPTYLTQKQFPSFFSPLSCYLPINLRTERHSYKLPNLSQILKIKTIVKVYPHSIFVFFVSSVLIGWVAFCVTRLPALIPLINQSLMWSSDETSR